MKDKVNKRERALGREARVRDVKCMGQMGALFIPPNLRASNTIVAYLQSKPATLLVMLAEVASLDYAD